MKHFFNDKTILITGGTGSLGKHFCQYLLKNTLVEKIIIYSRDEYKQYLMEEEFKQHKNRLRFFIGDIRDEQRLKQAFEGVDYVVHAAAMKHVTICEYNPFEAVKTNINGTQNIANMAIAMGVKKVIGISTDKAVNPSNLYGATKLAADKLLVAANSYVGKKETTLSVVRFGNFAGSRGSVIPLFQNLMQQGKTTFPITHPEMTRFWISLEQACEMTLEAIKQSQGGEIFIPKMPSFKITDLAKALDETMFTEIIGLREGERLNEILIGNEDVLHTYEYDNHYIIYPQTQRNAKDFSPKGSLVKTDFEYSSHNNSEWLSIEDIQQKIQTDTEQVSS